MEHIKHAVICAAGLGSRLGLKTTKCLVEVNHKKIIDYQLELLKDIPDVRIVVGFQSEKVIDYVRKIRNDITFIHNCSYRTTSSSYSAYLGTREIRDPFLILAGDLLIEKGSFFKFLEKCKSGQSGHSVVGITKAKSQDAIFVDLDKRKRVIGFQVRRNTGFEWPCVAFLNGIKIEKDNRYIYENLFSRLPIKSHVIDCYEIDTKMYLELAEEKFSTITFKDDNDGRILSS